VPTFRAGVRAIQIDAVVTDEEGNPVRGPFKGRDSVVRPEQRPGVSSALASPIPVGGVTLRAFAAPFRGRGKRAAIAVALETDPQALGWATSPFRLSPARMLNEPGCGSSQRPSSTRDDTS
jgi:hypothetical protein